MKDAEQDSTTTPFNSSVWLVVKTDGSWRMTAHHRKLNEEVTAIEAVIPDVFLPGDTNKLSTELLAQVFPKHFELLMLICQQGKQ